MTEELSEKVLMQLPVLGSEEIIDVWVFDTMAIARTKPEGIQFFMKPLSEGAFARRLTFNDTDKLLDSSAIYAGVFEGNYTTGIVDLYTATNSTIYINSFTLHPKNYTVTMTTAQHNDPSFNGSQMRMSASQNEIVLTCADCTKPSVVIYDKLTYTQKLNAASFVSEEVQNRAKNSTNQLEELVRFEMKPLGSRDYYNIAISNEKEIGYSQIFISGANSIDLIERVESKNGTYTHTKSTTSIYNNTEAPSS